MTIVMWLLALVGFWLILAGDWSWQVFLAAFLGAGLVIGLNRNRLVEWRELPGLNWRGLRLWMVCFCRFVLAMIKANLQVTRIVLSSSMPISPCVIRFRTRLNNTVSRVLLANSITLTPGTLTLDVGENSFLVHALTEEAADEVKAWVMEDLLVQLETAGTTANRKE